MPPRPVSAALSADVLFLPIEAALATTREAEAFVAKHYADQGYAWIRPDQRWERQRMRELAKDYPAIADAAEAYATGTPDLFVYRTGTTEGFYVEVKRLGDDLSVKQILWLARRPHAKIVIVIIVPALGWKGLLGADAPSPQSDGTASAKQAKPLEARPRSVRCAACGLQVNDFKASVLNGRWVWMPSLHRTPKGHYCLGHTRTAKPSDP